MVDSLLQGHGTIGNDFSVNPGIPMYCREIPQHDYDPDKAKFYWDKTGLSGIEVFCANTAGDFAVDATILLKESAQGGRASRSRSIGSPMTAIGTTSG